MMGGMTDLNALVPPHEPAEDALAFAGRAALSQIPLVGPLAADALAHAMESRQAQRQYDFNVAIARSLTAVVADQEHLVNQIITSDEFIAAVTRAQRAAAETASENKRHRLAAAVASGGSWAPFTASEREQFTRLVSDFDDLHIWLLHYFVNPAEWLRSHDLYDQLSSLMMGGITSGLEVALTMPQSVWKAPVTQAAADLDRNGLAHIPLTTMMGLDGVVAGRTTEKGSRFLLFLNEPDSVAADAPTDV